MSNFPTIRLCHVTTEDVAREVSAKLQEHLQHERHAVKRLCKLLRCGVSKAEKLLYGDLAPKSADLINLIRELDDEFAQSILRALTGKDFGPTDRGRALKLANLLQERAAELRRLANHDEATHDRTSAEHPG